MIGPPKHTSVLSQDFLITLLYQQIIPLLLPIFYYMFYYYFKRQFALCLFVSFALFLVLGTELLTSCLPARHLHTRAKALALPYVLYYCIHTFLKQSPQINVKFWLVNFSKKSGIMLGSYCFSILKNRQRID